MEQVLRPFVEDVVALYVASHSNPSMLFFLFRRSLFIHVYLAFPIVEEILFFNHYRNDDVKSLSDLVYKMYISALIYWNCSGTLWNHPCPDIRFAWNQTVPALHEDFSAPSTLIVQAALLRLPGRPTSLVHRKTFN